MNKTLYRTIRDKGVTAPVGFMAGAINAGLKNKGKTDLALVCSTVPAAAAGVFTTNAVKAAPVLLSMKNIAHGRAQAIVANSGCANCCTGEQGMTNARALAAAVADELNMPARYLLTASTGKIGKHLPMEKILPKVGKLIDSIAADGGLAAAEGIMTTDTVSKHSALSYKEGKTTVRVGGICKGAGMICPDMATMLCFITTDCAIEPAMLKAALADAVSESFNRINIDGDMSTNDTVIALANGMADNAPIKTKGAAWKRLRDALARVCDSLARQIVADAEGGTKTLEIVVSGAKTQESAETIARKISNSILFRSAMSAGEPIWGRLMAALGCVETKVDQTRMNIGVGGFKVFKKGVPAAFDQKAAARKLRKEKEISVEIDMGAGKASARVLTSDLTPEYVVINQS